MSDSTTPVRKIVSFGPQKLPKAPSFAQVIDGSKPAHVAPPLPAAPPIPPPDASRSATDAFVAAAPSVQLILRIGGRDYTVDRAGDPRAFSTGSFGWFVSGKARGVEVDGRAETVQVSCNLIVVGSKGR